MMKFKHITIAIAACLSLHVMADINQSEVAEQALLNGDYAIAEQHYSNALKQSPNNSDLLFKLAKSQANMAKLDQAAETVLQAERSVPKSNPELAAHIQHLKGVIYEELAENSSIFSMPYYAKTAKQSLEAAVSLAPQNIDFQTSLVGFYLHAPSLLGGSPDEALALAKRSFREDSLASYMLLMEAYDELRFYDDLYALYQTAQQRFGQDVQTDFKMAQHWFGKRDFDKATQLLKQVIANDKASAAQVNLKLLAMYDLARISIYTDKNHQQGITALEQYLALHVDKPYSAMPANEWALFRMANLYQLQGSNAKAVGIYQQLKASTSNEQLLDDIDDKLDEL